MRSGRILADLRPATWLIFLGKLTCQNSCHQLPPTFLETRLKSDGAFTVHNCFRVNIGIRNDRSSNVTSCPLIMV